MVVGIKIYDYKGKFPELFKEWNHLGINTAFISTSLDSNKMFRELAKQNNVKLFVILPIFFNPEALQKNPDWYAISNEGNKAIDEWVRFVCPSQQEYRKQRIESIKNFVKEFNPDGISLDFIRHFVFWEMIDPDRTLESIQNTCFCTNCMNQFDSDTGIKISAKMKSTKEIVEWIISNHQREWINWKCGLITSMVKDIVHEAKKVKPDILVNIHAVPWQRSDYGGAIKIIAGQDIYQISQYADYISPMCYHHMVKRNPSWIHDVVKDLDEQVDCKILPSIQVKEAYLSKKLTNDDFQKSLDQAMKHPSDGVVFWSWEAFDKDFEKKRLLAR